MQRGIYQIQKELLICHELRYSEDFWKNYAAPINEKLEKSSRVPIRKIINNINIYFKLTPDSFVLTTPKLKKPRRNRTYDWKIFSTI